VVVGREAHVGATRWLNVQAVPLSARAGIQDLGLLSRGNWQLDPALWSLHWEVVFSLILPLVVLILVRFRRLHGLLAVGVCGALLASRPGSVARLMPPFFIGALLALHATWLAHLRARLGESRVVAMLGLTFVAVALTAQWWLRIDDYALTGHRFALADRLGALLVLLGAGVAVALPLVCGAVAKTLNSRSVQWAGSRSFSLYLVHVPVIVTIAFALGGHPRVATQIALGVPLALLVAEAFYRVAERPSHRRARRAGAAVDAQWRSRPRPRTASAG